MDTYPESGRPWSQTSYHTLTWLVPRQRVHPWQYCYNNLSRGNRKEIECIQCLLIREAIVTLNVGANSREERGVQTLQEEIGIRDEGFPAR